ncbi:hypothetical protein NS506_07702 [Nocardia seriolae]|uniref:Uncharacterized protein n=1 Tax=Nocardia seriolae TaxID=37332 RepID=A0ABC8B568_9NOCA|nr:hypothetical protein [Nocardia seriolae]APB01721.1 hypothetical protein NS506_07702 [Nocardia seriolae]
MTIREFAVPTDRELIDQLGITFDDEGPGRYGIVRAFDLTANNGDVMKISYDIPGGSFRYRWSQGGQLISDSFREGAVLLKAYFVGEDIAISVTFDTDGLRGSLEITVGDAIKVRDEMFFS